MKIEIIVKGVSGKSGFFLIELPIELPIDCGAEAPPQWTLITGGP